MPVLSVFVCSMFVHVPRGGDRRYVALSVSTITITDFQMSFALVN